MCALCTQPRPPTSTLTPRRTHTPSLTHTHTHPHTHTHTHTYIHTEYAYTHTYIHIHTIQCSLAHSRCSHLHVEVVLLVQWRVKTTVVCFWVSIRKLRFTSEAPELQRWDEITEKTTYLCCSNLLMASRSIQGQWSLRAIWNRFHSKHSSKLPARKFDRFSLSLNSHWVFIQM